MTRGTSKQRIFHDEKDRHSFPEGLRKYKSLSGLELYVYCLMPNRLHLLLREGKEIEPIDKIMRSLGTWYVSAAGAAMSEADPCLQAGI